MDRWLVAPDDSWRIPAYAQSMLWVCHGDRVVAAQGDQGCFSLGTSPDLHDIARLAVRWGSPTGPELATWLPDEWASATIVGWLGEVAIGGFVERLHALTVRGLAVVVAELDGGALPGSYVQMPDLDMMRSGVFARGDDDLVPGPPGLYTIIAEADSLAADFLHHALVNELPLDCWGSLGPDAGRWHEIVGLPILLDSVTLLAPRRR